jgi:peptide/nickel transport system permease protein
MFSYIIRRLMQMVVTLFVISVLGFAIVFTAPGDPFSTGLDPTTDPVAADIKTEEYRLNAPLYEQYTYFYGTMLRDFAVLATEGVNSTGFNLRSFKTNEPVVPTMWRKMLITLPLFIVTLLLVWTFAFPVGIYSAMNRGTLKESGITVGSYTLIAVPNFALGLLVVMVLTVYFDTPVTGPTTMATELTGLQGFFDRVWHVAVPGIVFALGGIAVLSRYVKGQMLEVLGSDFVRTARAKGLDRTVVNYKHALRNAALPFVTMIASILPGIFGGSVVMEAIFNWPGLGRWTFTAVMGKDYTIVITTLFVTSGLTLIGLLLSDLLYVVVDPRIKLS